MPSSYWGRLRGVTLLFVFDMDDVLYDYDWRARMASLTEHTGHDLHELRRRWWISGLEWKAEAGDPSDPDEYLAMVTETIVHPSRARSGCASAPKQRVRDPPPSTPCAAPPSSGRSRC